MESEWFTDKDSLTAIEKACWGLLHQAIADRSCGWRLPVLGTQSPSGVQQRVLVLRAVNSDKQQLLFHTDRRSPKYTQLAADPRVSLLFYDHARSIQLQARGTVSLHTNDGIAERLWTTAAPETLRGYLAPLAPGTTIGFSGDNLPQNVRGRVPTRAEVEAGRDQFAVICVCITLFDWLALSRTGNRRARIHYEAGHPTSAEWIAP